jgi:hypothetical protein
MIRSTGGWTCPDEFTAWALMERVGGHGAQGEVLPTEKAEPHREPRTETEQTDKPPRELKP